MFTVIVPVFNKIFYIEKCIESILNQSYKEFEIIIVNDGSTDSSLEKIKSLKIANSDCVQVINQENSGVSTARNNGVKNARNRYIAFLDADDWWEPTYLEDMKSLIEEYPGAGVYGSSYYLVKNDHKEIANIGVEPGFKSGLIDYFSVYAHTLCMPLWTGSTVIRKEIFESENGFKPILRLGEDFDLWVRVALKYPVAFLNRALANYNQDVEASKRAIGRLWPVEHHILWNLDYLADEEHTNPGLKQLLDNLRGYGLMPYFVNNETRNYARKELQKVDWSRQPFSAKKRYELPILLLKFWYGFMSAGSHLKQKGLRFLYKNLAR